MATLEALLRATAIPEGARALTIGSAPDATRKRIEAIVGRRTLDRVDLYPSDGALPNGAGLCFVTPSLARIADAFEELLCERLADSILPGGAVALLFCRDARHTALDALRIDNAQTREDLGAFLQHHFGAEAAGQSAIAAKFARGPFEFLGLAPRSRLSVEDDPLVWLVARRREGAEPGRAFPRSPRRDRFPLETLGALAARLKAAGIAFAPVDAFSARLAGATPAALIKLDIHRSIRRAFEAAETLAAAGAPALFLMMHRHPLNEAYYDDESTWRMLRDIEGMGHEVGLHLDPFHLIRSHGDLDLGLERALAEMRGKGLALRAATLHGDTAAHLRARDFFAQDFFREFDYRRRFDGTPPRGEEELAGHAGRYSLETIARERGLVYFAEACFVAGGQVLRKSAMPYLTDNSRTLSLLHAGEDMADERPFRISETFADRAARVLKDRSFLALFHPQWFW